MTRQVVRLARELVGRLAWLPLKLVLRRDLRRYADRVTRADLRQERS